MTKEPEEYITRLVDVSPVAMVVSAGTDERVILVNGKFTELFGYTIEDMPDVAHWWPLAYPDADYREEIKAQWSAKVERAIKNHSEIKPMEATVSCKDGSRRHVEFRLSSIGEWHLVTFADLTERKRVEERLRKEAERGNLLLELYERAPQLTEKQLYDYALDQAVRLTDSAIAFFHLVSDDQKTVILTTWNNEALKNCTASYATHYSIDKAGNWVDCVRLKRPVIYNDFPASPNQKGLPWGHSPVRRFMSIPVMEGDKVRIIFGVGNKIEEYDEQDVVQIQLVAHELQRLIRQRHAEEALRGSETMHRSVVTAMAEGVVFQAATGEITAVNPAAERILGRPAEQLIGQSSDDLQGGVIYEDGKPFPGELHPSMITLRTGQPQSNVVMGIHKPDGTLTWISINSQPLISAGESTPYAAVTTFHDITERKRAAELLHRREQEFRTLVENSPDIVARYDRECRRIYVNPAYQKATDIRVNELLGASPAQVSPLPAETAASLQDLLRKVIDTATPAEMDLVWRKADNTKRCFFIHVVPEFDPEGRVVSVMSISRDITERKRAEEEILKLNAELEQRVVERTADFQKKSKELQESQRALMNIVEDLNQKTLELELANNKLKELDQLKSMFIATMSHELRTPLNSIIGFSSILVDEWIGPLNNEQKENLSAVLRSGKHLLALINDVIDVSKIEAGQVDVSMEDFDLRNLISEAVTLFKKEIDEKGLHVKVDSIDQAMHSDRRRLFQCVVNLFSNAVKFTEKGEISVRTVLVKGKDAEPTPDLVEITVTDTGIGIKEEDMPKLFSAFVRIPSPLSLKVKGTGLGLYLVKKIAVDILKGDVTAKSTYGEGSSFCLKIPVNL